MYALRLVGSDVGWGGGRRHQRLRGLRDLFRGGVKLDGCVLVLVKIVHNDNSATHFHGSHLVIVVAD